MAIHLFSITPTENMKDCPSYVLNNLPLVLNVRLILIIVLSIFLKNLWRRNKEFVILQVAQRCTHLYSFQELRNMLIL